METSEPTRNDGVDPQKAKHLAARAIMALRSGFCVELLTSEKSDGHGPGIVCDWKSSRAAYSDDTRLVQRGFAFVYIGTIIDQRISGKVSDDLQAELSADMSSAQEARQTAVDWQLVSSVTETNPFAHVGYKLASRLIRSDEELIEQLCSQLMEKRVFRADELNDWFKAHACPLILDDLEQSTTF